MKKTLIAAAALSLSAGAFAQSTVTLFGVVDAAARYTSSNGLHVKQLGADGYNSSRLGFRGVEDLGGGLKAGFWLESGFAPDTGAQGDSARFWNRRVSVSLMGDFGEVRLGRGKTSTRLHIDDFDPFTTTGLGDGTRVYSTLGSGADTINRSDNQVNYFTPASLGGFYASADVAAGEGTGGKKMMGFRAGYKAGALNVAGGYEQTTSAINQKFKLTTAGVQYDFGMVRPVLNFTRTEYLDRKQDIFLLGATVTMGQSQFLASFSKAKANDAARNAKIGVDNGKMYALGYVYNLSKRTALYTTYVHLQNEGVGNFVKFASPAPAPIAGGKSDGFDFGIRHSF